MIRLSRPLLVDKRPTPGGFFPFRHFRLYWSANLRIRHKGLADYCAGY